MKAQLFTDGSCLGNPGPGGWAFLVRIRLGNLLKVDDSINVVRKQGGTSHTTNNRMELTAVIEGLNWLHSEHPGIDEIKIFSDSSWVVNTMKFNWKRKKNLDLWEELTPLLQKKTITWQWVRGHAGNKENEDCDKRAMKEALKKRF